MSNNLTKSLPRDVFLHLLSIISLVAVAVSFGTLLFQYVNVYFPDIVSDYSYYNRSGYFSTIRSALAALIVFLPVYIWVSKFLKKDLERNPEKRELKIRKWLLYLTLFVASLVIIVDLIVLLRSFLEGELTTRFILKVLSILFIAGSVFYYYINELRDVKNINETRMRMFSWVIIIVLILGGSFAFYVTGSPKQQRLVRLDERRINDLSIIQSNVISFWQSKNRLPQNLDELRNDIYGTTMPMDPETGKPYEYNVLGDLKFNLCAEFVTDSQLDPKIFKEFSTVPDYQFRNANWDHGKGRACFDRTIDPEIIRPLEKPIIR